METGFKALVVVNKALCFIFIIPIVATNSLLIWKHVRKTKFYFLPKNMIVISLAVGDVILALFPLIVDAVSVFVDSLFLKDNCRLILAYGTYKYFLIHFVFGLGLVVLGTEILLREKLKKLFLNQKPLVAIVASSTPWILGLLIVVPICLSKGGYFRCETLYSPETKYAVSVFVPASLALISSIVVLCVSTQGRSGGRDGEVSQIMLSGSGACRDMPTHHLETRPTDHTEEHLHLADQRNSTSEHHVMIQQRPVGNTVSGSHVVNQMYKSNRSTKKEKVRLLIMTVAYFLMVIPYGVFVITNIGDSFFKGDVLLYKQTRSSEKIRLSSKTLASPSVKNFLGT
ncbi:hypothetical protein Btru_024632 [Bulinus truncatus]|nr:hypothetical protein Btru_024632 [Bulinus truncatus]